MKNNYVKLSVLFALLMLTPLMNASAHKFMVSVQNFSFTPASITDVAVGDTIQWNWISGSHTTTSTSVPAGAATWSHSMSSSSTSFEYKVTVAGTYNYKCNIHSSMVASFTASETNGIADNLPVFGDLQISPNPASESVRLIFDPANSFTGSVRLMNLVGNTVWMRKSSFDGGLNRIDLSLSSLPKGLYLIELTDDKDHKVVRRLIVQ